MIRKLIYSFVALHLVVENSEVKRHVRLLLHVASLHASLRLQLHVLQGGSLGNLCSCVWYGRCPSCSWCERGSNARVQSLWRLYLDLLSEEAADCAARRAADTGESTELACYDRHKHLMLSLRTILLIFLLALLAPLDSLRRSFVL